MAFWGSMQFSLRARPRRWRPSSPPPSQQRTSSGESEAIRAIALARFNSSRSWYFSWPPSRHSCQFRLRSKSDRKLAMPLYLIRHPKPEAVEGICYGRARALAEPGAPVVTNSLMEMDFGSWEGKHWNAIPREGLDRWARDIWRYEPGGGENARELATRWRGWCDRVRLTHRDPIIAVTHAGII